MKDKNKAIEKAFESKINDFFAGYGVTAVNFGSHKLKIKKKTSKKRASISL